MKRTTRWYMRPAGLLVLFGGLFLYIWEWVDPSLIHHYQEPFFLVGRAFLVEHLSYPGGLSDYAGAFVGLFFRIGWLGAAVFTALAVILCAAWAYSLRRLGMPRDATRYLLPVFFIAWLYTRYDMLLSPLLGTAAALVLLAAFLRGSTSIFWLNQLIFLLLCSCVYYACDGVAAIFLALYLLHLFFDGRLSQPDTTRSKAVAAVVIAGTMAVLPWVMNRVLSSGLPVLAYKHLLPQRWGQDVSIEMLLFGSMLVAVAFLTVLAGHHPDGTPARPLARVWCSLQKSRWAAWSFAPLTGFLVLSCATLWGFDKDRKTLVVFDYLAATERWEDYLFLANESASHAVFTQSPDTVLVELAPVMLNLNRALCHMGLLGDKLFSYPQMLGASGLLLPDQKFCLLHRQVLLPRGRLLLELGRVNESEQTFHEAWAYFGPRASILRELARINMVKGRFEAARVFLNILKKELFHREWAIATEQQMDRDPTLAWDPDLTRLRACNLTEDCVGVSAYGPQEKVLQLLLVANPRNRMAYDYLMATFLLTGQEESLVKHLALLKNLGYKEMPRHCEEAVLSFAAKTKALSVETYGFKIRPETTRHFRKFQELARPCGNDPFKLWRALSATHADTYWFHDAMGMTKVELKDGSITGLGVAR